MSGEGFGCGRAAMTPRLCPQGFAGLPSGRAAMFDSLPASFVGAGFVPTARNGGVKKVQFFLKNFKIYIYISIYLSLPRNNGEFVSSPAASPAGILGRFPSQGAECPPIAASTTCLQPLW